MAEQKKEISTKFINSLSIAFILIVGVVIGYKVINDQAPNYEQMTGQERALSGLQGDDRILMEEAIDTMNNQPLSEQGLYDTLMSGSYGFTEDTAKETIEKLAKHIDWNEVALLRAQEYRSYPGLSGEWSDALAQAMKEQLTSSKADKFTESQAQYAIEHIDDKIEKSAIWIGKKA